MHFSQMGFYLYTSDSIDHSIHLSNKCYSEGYLLAKEINNV